MHTYSSQIIGLKCLLVRVVEFSDRHYIGSLIQPPVFSSYYTATTASSTQQQSFDKLEALIAANSNDVAIVNQTLKQLQVVVRTQDITTSQQQLKKQSEIATL